MCTQVATSQGVKEWVLDDAKVGQYKALAELLMKVGESLRSGGVGCVMWGCGIMQREHGR